LADRVAQRGIEPGQIQNDAALLFDAARDSGVSRIRLVRGASSFTVPADQGAADHNDADILKAIDAEAAKGDQPVGAWYGPHATSMGESVIPWAYRRRGEDGTPITVIAEVPSSWFWRSTLPLEGPANEVMIITSNGTVVARTDGQFNVTGGETLAEALRALE